MKIAVPLLLMLAACGQQAASQPSNEVTEAATAVPAKAPAKAFALDEQNELIEFHYGWSAEAAAVPQLAHRFQKEMEKVKAELNAGAKEEKAAREKSGWEFHGYMSSTDYQTAGQSDRLLSLLVEVGTYTGGAHGNHGTGTLLWDRMAVREIKISDLFAEPSNMDRLLTQRWCDALNKAREEKRGEPVGGDGMFDECPGLDEIAIIPADKDGDGKFERLLLVASPYVAGPYAEGSYDIDLAIMPDIVAAVKNEYRSSFETVQMQ